MLLPAVLFPCDLVMYPTPSPPKKMPDLSHPQPMGTQKSRHQSLGRSGWKFQTPTRGSKVFLAPPVTLRGTAPCLGHTSLKTATAAITVPLLLFHSLSSIRYFSSFWTAPNCPCGPCQLAPSIVRPPQPSPRHSRGVVINHIHALLVHTPRLPCLASDRNQVCGDIAPC